MNLQITLLLKLSTTASAGGATVGIFNDAATEPNAIIGTIGRVLDSQLSSTPSNVRFSWTGTLAPQTRYWIGLLRDPGSAITWARSSTSSGLGVAGEYTYDSVSESVLNGFPYQMLLTDGLGIFSDVQPMILGVGATGQVGSIHNYVIPGNAAVFTIGSLIAEIDLRFTGVSGTFSVGNAIWQTSGPPLGSVTMTMNAGSFYEVIDEFLEGATFEGLVGFAGAISTPDNTNVEMPSVLGIFDIGDLSSNRDTVRTLVGNAAQWSIGIITIARAHGVTGVDLTGNAGDFTSVISAAGWSMDDLLITTKPAQPDDFDVSLIYSDDKGATWSFPIEQPIGSLGNYQTDLQWQRLGMGRDRVFALQWSTPCKTSLIGVFIDAMTEGPPKNG